MNKNIQESERGPWDFIMFGITFFGFVFALGGVIIASAGVAITGLAAMVLGLFYYCVQRWLSE
ncbi:MAG TPA: hypothetical protein VN887_08420 [Candidatus Angelobacter sp.]|nr:hypothetical protein [Candidatus Angelobacter sp.]